jgi:hypothetical protein
MPVEFISAISPYPTQPMGGFDIDHARFVLPLVRQELAHQGVTR